MENEKRLIDADTALQRLQNALDDCHEFKHSFAYRAVELVAEFLQEIPAVDAVEVVHGRWIDAREYCGDYLCSNCDALYGTNKFNYCPNCGASMMDGDGNG